MQLTDSIGHCAECGAPLPEGGGCQDRLHQMIIWEFENPPLGEVHHLMVLCYHLQHPSLYSPDGLNGAMRLLVDFLVHGFNPEHVRRRDRAAVDSGKRKFKIKGTPASHGVYRRPVAWEITVADVTMRGPSTYRENVREWAGSILEALQASGNLS